VHYVTMSRIDRLPKDLTRADERIISRGVYRAIQDWSDSLPVSRIVDICYKQGHIYVLLRYHLVYTYTYEYYECTINEL
jgi:hypothetical protein